MAKVDRSTQNHRGRPRQPFLGLLVTILDFEGGAALQAVRLCRRCNIVDGAAFQAVSEYPLRG